MNQSQESRRSLVTGGTGFIGSNLVDALIERGDKLLVVDNISTGKRDNLSGAIANNARLIEADITDPAAISEIVGDFKPDVIFHLAAQIDVRKSVADPVFDSAVNIGGTINLLEAAREHKVGRFVFSSTGGAAYGEADLIPTPETEATNPEAPYGQAKVAAEGYLGLYRRLYGLSTVALRYGNVYGPRQDPLGEAGVIAIFCGKALQGQRPTVFGDGSQTRDYIYVSDVVEANLAAAESDITGAVNIGTGDETSVLDLIQKLAPHAKGDFTPVHEPARLGEMARSALDCSRARTELGWSPRVRLDEGIADSVAATHV